MLIRNLWKLTTDNNQMSNENVCHCIHITCRESRNNVIRMSIRVLLNHAIIETFRVNIWGQQVEDDMAMKGFGHLLLDFIGCMGAVQNLVENIFLPTYY